MSYDIQSLFTSIPVSETIDYIIKQIHENKVIKPICKSKLIFRRLLEKLTKNCVFNVNNTLVKQVKGCPMGGAISVIMSGIHMKRMEKDWIAPLTLFGLGWDIFIPPISLFTISQEILMVST